MSNKYVHMRSINKIINRVNRNGLKFGNWEYYHSDGVLESKGRYKDGDREGVWEYYENDIIVNKEDYGGVC